MNNHRQKGFTIIELLVVVSIIALLIGILLPAIGKARDQAHLTRSQSNLRQLVVAHNTYGAEWNDNQWTLGPHNIASYGSSHASAVQSYAGELGDSGKMWSIAVNVGFVGGANPGSWWFTGETIAANNMFMPIGIGESGSTGITRFGYFRMQNVLSFSNYLNGKFYDSVFYAPKDRAVLAALGECLDQPGGCIGDNTPPIVWPSYILSPAALLNPNVMTPEFWEDNSNVWGSPGSLRTPTFSQARYADMKSHITEHHWLQNAERPCSTAFTNGPYEGCQPDMFNHSTTSVPQTAFYDGHIAGLQMQETFRANKRIVTQDSNRSLWLTSHLNGIGDWGDGYYEPAKFPSYGEAMSPHILTTNGIQGRDRSPN